MLNYHLEEPPKEENHYQINFVNVPTELFMNKQIDKTCCILFSLIQGLDNPERHCWASNRYFSTILDLSITTISTSISFLIKEGYLENISQDPQRRILKVSETYKQKHQDKLIALNERHRNFNKHTIKEPLKDPFKCLKDPIKEGLIQNSNSNNTSRNILELPNGNSTSPGGDGTGSTEFINLKNKRILFQECSDIVNYWNQFGSPMKVHKVNLLNPSKTIQQAFITISKELKRLPKEKIMESIYFYYDMISDPDKYDLHCENPLHLVDICDFFKMSDYMKKKQMSAKEGDPAKNIKSWYWECAQGENNLKKFLRKQGTYQRTLSQENLVEDINPKITETFKLAWKMKMSEDPRYKNGNGNKDENSFRKASALLIEFLKKWEDELDGKLPFHEFDGPNGSLGDIDRPHCLAWDFIPAIDLDIRGETDIIITPSWLCTENMSNRLLIYYKHIGVIGEGY